MPHVIIIAGPNGAGKTTAAPALLNKALNISHFVNADAIAAGLSAFAPEKAAIPAGKAMLERIHQLSEANENFAFETTLASRSFAFWLAELKKERKYIFNLAFLLLSNPDLAVYRVAERVKAGGHSVPEATIRRRYKSGLCNFFNLYSPIADSWQLYDNSLIEPLNIIAEKKDSQLVIHQSNIWHNLENNYGKNRQQRQNFSNNE